MFTANQELLLLRQADNLGIQRKEKSAAGSRYTRTDGKTTDREISACCSEL
jgi:hypothetical protein